MCIFFIFMKQEVPRKHFAFLRQHLTLGLKKHTTNDFKSYSINILFTLSEYELI